MRLLIILLSLSLLCCASTSKQHNSKKYKSQNKRKTSAYILTRSYPKQIYVSDVSVDMSVYEMKLRRKLPADTIVIRHGNKIGLAFRLEKLLEGANRTAVKPEAFVGVLSSLAYILLTNRGTYIQVLGHDDNWDIAQTRANAVAGYLCLRGVDRRRVSAIGSMDEDRKNFIEILIKKA